MVHKLNHHFMFYGVAIGSVTLFFLGVSRYGERTLKAPPNINGRYVLAAPPTCAEETRLVLTIEQSGTYLSGSLKDSPSESTNLSAESGGEEPPSLSGLWQQQQVVLTGSVPAIAPCNQTDPALVKIQGSLSETSDTFTGQLMLGESAPIDFSSPREALQREEHH